LWASPESNPIAVEDLPAKRDEEVLLRAMGSEVANVHLGQRQQVRHILKNLQRRETKWLRTAAKKMTAMTLKEWKEYRG
jgi:transcriptional regulator of NAD metabolism